MKRKIVKSLLKFIAVVLFLSPALMNAQEAPRLEFKGLAPDEDVSDIVKKMQIATPTQSENLSDTEKELRSMFPDEKWTDLDDLLAKRMHCVPNETMGSDTRCVNNEETIAGVRASLTIYLKNNYALNIRILFSSVNFSIVVGALEEKYGKPDSEAINTVRNAIGETFQNITKTWKSGNSTMTAEKYPSTIVNSAITIEGKMYREAAKEDTEKRIKEGAKDL